MTTNPPLSGKDRLLGALVAIEQHLPGGYLVAMKVRLDECIEQVEELFTEHQLQMREEVVAELTRWRCHVDEGLRVMGHSEQALHSVIRSVADRRA